MELNYNDYLTQLNNNDIIEHQDKLFKVEKLKSALNSAFDSALPTAIHKHIINQGITITVDSLVEWFQDGVDLKILQAGSKGWKEGKLKINISIEFVANDLEKTGSPLDEIRQEMQNNQ